MKAKWIGGFAAILFLVWPAHASQAPTPAPARNESAQADSRDRKEVEAKLQAKLDDLDREIKDLKDKTAKQGKKAGQEIQRQLDDLDRKRTVARRKLKQLERSSQGAWEETKKGFDAVMKDLEETYRRAASHF
jgi:chromosome segregation ATPase